MENSKDNNLISYHNDEVYQNFIDELRAIITERVFNSNYEILACKWEIGQRLVQEKGKLEKIYGERIIETIAKDLKTSASNLWRCMQFYKKFQFENFDEVLSHLPEGKAIAWWKVKKYILPKLKEDELKEEETDEKQSQCPHNEEFICRKCRKRFTVEELRKIFLL